MSTNANKKRLFHIAVLVAAIAIFWPNSSLFVTAAQSKDTQKIPWITLEEAEKSAPEDDKKILVYLRSANIGWVKRFESRTLRDPTVTDYIRANYHAVWHDEMHKEDIVFKGRVFKFDPDAGYRGRHELVPALLGSDVGYPAMVVIDSDVAQILGRIDGYKTGDELMVLLSYYTTDAYKTIDFEFYKKSYPAQP